MLLAFGLRARGRAQLLMLSAAVAGLAAVLAFPYARAASAALLASCGAAIVIGSPHRRRALALVAVLVVGAGALVMSRPSLRARFVSGLTTEGSGNRSMLAEAGVRAVRMYPMTGMGAGRFRVREWVPAEAPTALREHPGKAHNQLLSVAAELGLPGLALFLFLLVSVARRMRPSTPAGVAGAVHLVEQVLPHAPYRQWTLSFPHRVRWVPPNEAPAARRHQAPAPHRSGIPTSRGVPGASAEDEPHKVSRRLRSGSETPVISAPSSGCSAVRDAIPRGALPPATPGTVLPAWETGSSTGAPSERRVLSPQQGLSKLQQPALP
jgi:hypothetical protein